MARDSTIPFGPLAEGPPPPRRRRRGRRLLVLVVALLSLVAGTQVAWGPAQLEASELPGAEAAAAGAFTCDLTLAGDFPLDKLPPVLERDRIYMAERPGMLHKHVPMRPDPATNRIFAGGRYLFKTAEDARSYKHWVEKDYVLVDLIDNQEGQHFFERSYFLARDCHDWAVVGARQFNPDLGHQLLIRTERFRVPEENQDAILRARYPQLVREAADRNYTAIWLLYNKSERLVSLVYFTDRQTPANPDLVGMAALEADRPLGDAFGDRGWPRTFDRTHFTLQVWYPYEFADRGRRSLWPFSPPLPLPLPTDGVCVPSWGEKYPTAPDCPATCGDGIAQTGETTKNCPCDVRIPNRG